MTELEKWIAAKSASALKQYGLGAQFNDLSKVTGAVDAEVAALRATWLGQYQADCAVNPIPSINPDPGTWVLSKLIDEATRRAVRKYRTN